VRIAVITQSRDRVGGVETYLEAVLPALARNHQVALGTASSNVTSRGAIKVPAGVTLFELDGHGAVGTDRLRAWNPEMVFAHGLEDAALETAVLQLAPAVIVEHTYHGTCISSSKTMSRPNTQACERVFGPACLALYFPRGCGGSSPLTMARLYRAQSVRLHALKNAAAVITLSSHMANEMLRNGVPRERVHVVPPFVTAEPGILAKPSPDRTCRLLYLGRLERLKGVHSLLRALSAVAAQLNRPVRLAVAGDGGEREALMRLAADVCREDPWVAIQFLGWTNGTARADLFAGVDALVVPSLWPEPFGLVGLEAAAAGVPAVAFPVGGIPEWLHDGETGCLALPGTDRAAALADAIVRCVGSEQRHARLAEGARRAAARATLDLHVAGLEQVFNRVVPALCAAGAP